MKCQLVSVFDHKMKLLAMKSNLVTVKSARNSVRCV